MACDWGCLLAPVEPIEPACARLWEAWLEKVRAWGSWHRLGPVSATLPVPRLQPVDALGCVSSATLGDTSGVGSGPRVSGLRLGMGAGGASWLALGVVSWRRWSY